MHSETIELNDSLDVMEYYYSKGWTDGLPVVPPTKGAVRAMLDAAGLEADSEITNIEDRKVSVKAEKVAINAVMAGCKPAYMPVIVAALEAMGDPLYSYHGPSTSTGGAAVLILVNGPIARELEINCGENLFGPGWRANATIGRAVRLVMRNVIGTVPGRLDRSTLGHAGKYTFCIAENEEKSPWPPLHVERGFQPEQSAVTVLAGLGPHQFYNQLSNTAEGILSTACAHMRISPGAGNPREYVILLAGEHMQIMAKDGWSKQDIREYCFRHTLTSVAELKRLHLVAGDIRPEDENTLWSVVQEPKDFMVVAAGGEAGSFSCYIPAWSNKKSSQSVTREIHNTLTL